MCCVAWCAREVWGFIVYVVAAVFFLLVFVLMTERLVARFRGKLKFFLGHHLFVGKANRVIALVLFRGVIIFITDILGSGKTFYLLSVCFHF